MEQKQFGRYVIVAELGRGAMGAVHRAVDPLIERDVAIKTLLPNLPPEIMEEVRGRFLREARSAGRLNHPNIVTIYDVGEQDGVAYIAMELLEGQSLQQILRAPERLPIERIADLAAQVADGLDLAQRYKITHRDVKPANIMVSPDWRAKLTDFGVAHVASSSMTQTGAALGSPKYMSPEQVTGQPLDPRSDIFSLGAVLYEMLVGRTPFERSTDTSVFALMNRIAADAHASVTRINTQIPAVFDAILDKALRKSPEQRYQRAGDMANDLRNYQSPSGAAARPAKAAPVRADPATATLIDDLAVFAEDFERREQETLRVEAAERERKEEALRRWGEEELRRREAFERERDSKTGATPTGQRRSAAIDLLKKTVAGKTAAIDVARSKKSESIALLDERLRAAFRYLSEFATVLNEANPVSERKQGVTFFGERENMILGEGFTDMRTRDVSGKACADHVTFRYRVRFATPAKLEVPGQEMQRLQDRLKAMGLKYEMHGSKGEAGRSTFMLSGPFPCETVLRADYDEPGVVVEMHNVRRHGAVKLRLAIEELTDDVLDEFGTWVLGADDAFERFLARK